MKKIFIIFCILASSCNDLAPIGESNPSQENPYKDVICSVTQTESPNSYAEMTICLRTEVWCGTKKESLSLEYEHRVVSGMVISDSLKKYEYSIALPIARKAEENIRLLEKNFNAKGK